MAGLREAIGAQLSPAERARHDQALTATRAALDEATFSQCWGPAERCRWSMRSTRRWLRPAS